MISKSPDRNTFQKTGYLERQAEKGLTPENDADTKEIADYYDSGNIREEQREADPEWQKNNLEYDLRTCDWILEKVRKHEYYAQNLYAAMCNRDFTKREMWPLLKEEKWSCSWRYAGGIIAHMRQEGDYIDWYCSGIRGDWSDEEYHNSTKEDQEKYLYMKNNFVGEGHVTDEIAEDLYKLGWIVNKEDE